MWAVKSQSWKDQHKVNVLINLRNHRVVFTVEDGAWWSWVPRPSSLMNQLVVKITLGIIGLLSVEDHWVSMGWARGIKWNEKGRRRGSSSDYAPSPSDCKYRPSSTVVEFKALHPVVVVIKEETRAGVGWIVFNFDWSAHNWLTYLHVIDGGCGGAGFPSGRFCGPHLLHTTPPSTWLSHGHQPIRFLFAENRLASQNTITQKVKTRVLLF